MLTRSRRIVIVIPARPSQGRPRRWLVTAGIPLGMEFGPKHDECHAETR